MQEINVRVPNVVTIAIVGPTQSGKSIVMSRIKDLLEGLNATVILSDELKSDFNGNDYDDLAKWQKDMVSKTVWFLAE